MAQTDLKDIFAKYGNIVAIEESMTQTLAKFQIKS